MKSRDREEARQSAAPSHRYLIGVVFVLLMVISAAAQSKAAELQEATEAAWNRYVHSVCLRTEAQAKASSFLQIDGMPARLRRVQSGEIPVWRDAQADSPHVAHALIHQWAGAVFIAGATIADVLAVTRDYARYPEIYKPAVIEANAQSSDGNDDTFSMLLMQKVLFVTAAIKGEYQTRYVQVNKKQWYSISQSTRLQAIEKFGQPDMRMLPPDQGPGYIWRLYTITKFEESDGGVYVELEALGLSRDVPVMFRWLVDPIVEHLPRNSVQATLEETRHAVLARIAGDD